MKGSKKAEIKNLNVIRREKKIFRSELEKILQPSFKNRKTHNQYKSRKQSITFSMYRFS